MFLIKLLIEILLFFKYHYVSLFFFFIQTTRFSPQFKAFKEAGAAVVEPKKKQKTYGCDTPPQRKTPRRNCGLHIHL